MANINCKGVRNAEQNISTIIKEWNERNTTNRNDPPVVRFAKQYQEFLNTGRHSDIVRATDGMLEGQDARDAFLKLAASRFGSDIVWDMYTKAFKKYA